MQVTTNIGNSRVNLKVPHQVAEIRSREDILSKSQESAGGSRRSLRGSPSASGKRRPASATANSRSSPMYMGRLKTAVTPSSGVPRSTMGVGYRQPPLYHIGSYPERMPKARAELSKLGGMLDGLLGDMRVSADDLKAMEDSAMVLGSFSREKLLPDQFIDPAEANIGEADMAFDTIVSELVRQAVVKVYRLGTAYRNKADALEAKNRDHKKKKDKYKTLAMCADDHQQHFIDELAQEPYKDLPISLLKKRLKETELNVKGLISKLNDTEDKLRRHQVQYTDLFHVNESASKELQQLRAEKGNLVPVRFMDIVTDQCDSYVSENAEMRHALVNYDVMKVHLEDKKKELQLVVGEKNGLQAQILREELRVEEVKTAARIENSLLQWRLATALMRPKANEKSKYAASEEAKAVLPYISLSIPQPIVITKQVAGVKALDKDATIAHCCKLLQAKVAADAADIKRGDDREAMPAYIEEYFTRTTKGGSREATKLFQSLVMSLKQQYRHAGGSHKIIGVVGTLAGLIRPEAYAPHNCHLVIALLQKIFADRPKGIANALQYNELLPVAKFEEAIVGSQGQRQVPSSWELTELKNISPSPPEVQSWMDDVMESLVHTGPTGDEKIAILEFIEKVIDYAASRTMVHHVELQSLFKELDEDGSGHLSFEEFKTMSTKRLINIPQTEKGLLKLFNKINSLDDDPDDLVDPSVFSTVLIRKGVLPTNAVAAPLSRASVRAMLKFAAASAKVQTNEDEENDGSEAAGAEALPPVES